MDLRIKELCKEKGILLKDLANELGITNVALSQIITRKPTLTTLERIAKVLGVEVWELLINRDEIIKTSSKTAFNCPHCGKSIVFNFNVEKQKKD